MLCIMSLAENASKPGRLIIAPDDPGVEPNEVSGGSCTNGDIWTEGGGTRFPLRYA